MNANVVRAWATLWDERGRLVHLRWRAVFCKPRAEQRARMHLINQGFEVFLPQVRSRRRRRGRDRLQIEPMFPRYLFVALADLRQDWGPIRSTRGVVGLVRFGAEVPVVPDSLIELLKTRQDAEGAIELARVHRLKSDDPVEITAGPFAGYRGIFEAETGKARAMILLELLNGQRRVEIATADLRRA